MILRKIFVPVLLVCFLTFSSSELYVESAYAGPFDGIKRSYNKGKQKTRDAINRGKSKAKDSYNRGKRKAKDSYSRGKKRANDSYKNQKRKTANRLTAAQKRARAEAKRKQQQISRMTNRAKSNGINASRQFQATASRHGGRASDRLSTAYTNYSDKTMRQIGEVKKRYGAKTHQVIDDVIVTYGSRAGERLASVIAKSRSGGVAIARNTAKNMAAIKSKIKDPRTQQKAMKGVAIASAVAYYSYKNRDDIKYKATRHIFENVEVSVNGRNGKLGNVISQAILEKAPYLEGTDIAEDPAAIIAYGLVDVGKRGLMSNLEIMPDGKGGMISVNETIDGSYGTRQTVDALQLGSSLEGMAMNVAEDGQLGTHGQTFAATYGNMESRFGG